jgi:hypothetical protein
MHAIDWTPVTRTQFVRRSPSRRRTIAVGAFLFLVAVGCGGDGPVAPGIGSGSVTASGAVSASGNGLAIFQSLSSGGTSLFQIVIAPLTQNAGTWEVQIASYSGRPEAGTYALAPLSASPTTPTANFYYNSAGAIQLFSATTGELVITSSSATEVRGTFTFTATDAGSNNSITAHGSFQAQCAPGTPCL